MLPNDLLSGSPLGSLMLFEVPTVLFYTLYSTVLYLWARIVLSSAIIRTGSCVGFNSRKGLLRVYIGLNLSVVILFIAFLIAYYVVGDASVLPCVASSTLTGRTAWSVRRNVNLAYVVFLAILAVLSALMISVLGLVFIRRVNSMTDKHKRRSVLILTAAVLVVFIVCFLVRCVLTLWAAVVDSMLPLAVIALLELLPATALIVYLVPLRNAGVCGFINAVQQRRKVSSSSPVTTKQQLTQSNSGPITPSAAFSSTSSADESATDTKPSSGLPSKTAEESSHAPADASGSDSSRSARARSSTSNSDSSTAAV